MSSKRRRQRYKLKGTPQERLDKAFMKAYRAEAVARQAHECVYCYDPITPSTATADHIVPRSKGGRNNAENIDALCSSCNSLKGSMSKREYANLIGGTFPTGQRMSIMMAWSRRRMNLQIRRSIRNLHRAFGWPEPIASHVRRR